MVEISNMDILNKKISSFNTTFNSNKNRNKILYITDFDYTITRKYDYSTGEKFHSTYSIYNQEVFGGNQSLYLAKDKEMAEYYGKYEEDTSFDFETRKNKSFEWYYLSLLNMSNEKLKPDSFKKMVELVIEHIKFRNDFKILFETLIKNDIPIVVISGGIKEIIIEILRVLKIEGFEDYLKNKRIIIIANYLLDNNGKLVNWEERKEDIIYPFNKDIIIKKNLEKYFDGFEKIIIVGDLITDYQSIDKINIDKKENVLSFGFLEYNPAKIKSDFDFKNDDTFKEYLNIFDVVFIKDQGYKSIIDSINKIISK